MLGGAARRPRAARLADLLLIRPHQVAAMGADPGQKRDTGDRTKLDEG